MKKAIRFFPALCLLMTISNFVRAVDTPTLATPANNSTVYMRNTGFFWAEVAGANSYDIQIADDTGFTNIVAARQDLNIARFVPVSSLPLSTLYWRVRATDTAGALSTWSGRYTCTIASPANLYTVPAGASLAAIKDSLRKAIRNTPAVLSFAANATYYLDAGITGLFTLDTANVNNLIIEGNNATFIIKNHSNVGFLRLQNSNKVTVRRLKVDWDPLPHSLLDVIKVNNGDSNVLNINVRLRSVAGQSSPFYPAIANNPAFTTFWSWAYLLDTADRGSLKKTDLNIFGLSPDDVTPLACKDTPVYNIYHPGTKSGKYFAVGDILSIVARDSVGPFVSTTKCTEITFDSVTNYASPIGCYYSYEGSDFKVLNCQAALKDSSRFVSANADGVHCRANTIGPWIENSSFIGNADDGVALYNKGIAVKGKVNDTCLQVYTNVMNLQKGHQFRIFTPKTGAVMSTVFTVDTVVLKSGAYLVRFLPAMPAADYAALTDVGGTGTDYQQYVQLYNTTLRNEKFMVYNNRFTVRARGSIIRAAKGVVAYNKYYGCSSAAIAIYNEAQLWYNGLYSRDLWIHHNDIRNCSFDNLGVDGGAINVRVNRIVAVGSTFDDTLSSVSKDHANLSIRYNTITNFAQHGISLFNATGCTIDSNTFISTLPNFRLPGNHYGIYINTTANTSISNTSFGGETRTLTNTIQHTNDTGTTITP